MNFTLDEDFNCGPGTVDGIAIQRIVDIAVLNKKMFDKPIPKAASILALDEAGNYLFCVPNLDPEQARCPHQPADGGTSRKLMSMKSGFLSSIRKLNNMWLYKHDDSTAAS